MTGIPAGHGRSVFQVTAPGGGQALELHAVIGDKLLVGGDHAFARFERAPHPCPRGIESADELHNHVYIRGENGVGVFAPDDTRWRPIDALALHAAVEHLRQLKPVRL